MRLLGSRSLALVKTGDAALGSVGPSTISIGTRRRLGFGAGGGGEGVEVEASGGTGTSTGWLFCAAL